MGLRRASKALTVGPAASAHYQRMCGHSASPWRSHPAKRRTVPVTHSPWQKANTAALWTLKQSHGEQLRPYGFHMFLMLQLALSLLWMRHLVTSNQSSWRGTTQREGVLRKQCHVQQR